MLKGDLNFGTPSYGQSSAGQILARHIHDCYAEELLDLIELAFKVTDLFLADMPSIKNSNNEFVNAINVLFPDRPLAISTDAHGLQVRRPQPIRMECRKHNRVPRRQSSTRRNFTHNEAVLPALHALTDPRFASANSELRKALNDYQDGRYGYCIRNCCNSLESTIKAIHKANNWVSGPDSHPRQTC